MPEIREAIKQLTADEKRRLEYLRKLKGFQTIEETFAWAAKNATSDKHKMKEKAQQIRRQHGTH